MKGQRLEVGVLMLEVRNPWRTGRRGVPSESVWQLMFLPRELRKSLLSLCDPVKKKPRPILWATCPGTLS
jgi:hypothetical protein